jgi:hypothetical protein
MSDQEYQMSASEKKKEDWMNSKWRPMMGWMYMGVCIFDFMIAPILWSLIQSLAHGQVNVQWQPLTLQGAGLFHVAMGAVLGIAAYGRTQEKLNGANNGGLQLQGGTTYQVPGQMNNGMGGMGMNSGMGGMGMNSGMGGMNSGTNSGFGGGMNNGSSGFGSSGGFGSPSGSSAFGSPSTGGFGSPSSSFGSTPAPSPTPTSSFGSSSGFGTPATPPTPSPIPKPTPSVNSSINSSAGDPPARNTRNDIQ